MEEFLRQRVSPNDKLIEAGKNQKMFFFNPPMSDLDIIELHNLLMTPAVHHITTKNIETGRFLMDTFLDSLKHYHHVGCFTFTKKEKLNKNIFNFLNLQRKQNIANFIESFFIENPQVDFAWIESTLDFKAEISEHELNNLCQILTAHGQTPVVIMNYQEYI